MATPSEILCFVTIGAVVSGAVLGWLFGWVIAAIGIQWWGHLIGLFIGQAGLGNRWAAATIRSIRLPVV